MDSELNQRLERIESALAHLQHDMDGLNTSLLNHFRRLAEIDERFLRLEHEFQATTRSTDKPDPALEKPPHY